MKQKVMTAIILLMMTLMITTGCGTDDIDISGYADDEIILAGIADKDVIITIQDLKAMDCVTVKTESTVTCVERFFSALKQEETISLNCDIS